MVFRSELASLTAAFALSLTLLTGCGSQKAAGKLVDGTGTGQSVDKPKTVNSSLDQPYKTILAPPMAGSGVQSALSNLLFTPNSGAQMLRVNTLSLNSTCQTGVDFYYTWGVLADDGTVLEEIASPTRIIESGHRYLLRVYPAKLETGCKATVTYSASGDGTISSEASLLWPRVSYFSYQRFAVGTIWQPNATLSLEIPDGIPQGGDLTMRLNLIRTRPNGERAVETVFNIDGIHEKLTVSDGRIMAACTKQNSTMSFQVGTISGSSIAIEKQILASGTECKETPRLFRFNRSNHGLIDFSVLNNVNQTIRAVMAPYMGLSSTP